MKCWSWCHLVRSARLQEAEWRFLPSLADRERVVRALVSVGPGQGKQRGWEALLVRLLGPTAAGAGRGRAAGWAWRCSHCRPPRRGTSAMDLVVRRRGRACVEGW